NTVPPVAPDGRDGAWRGDGSDGALAEGATGSALLAGLAAASGSATGLETGAGSGADFCAGSSELTLPSPSTSSSTSGAPTASMSPIAPWIAVTVPSTGDVISTVALSVITSTSDWSSVITSPGLTCQPTISASATPSPISGRRKT